MSTRPSSHGPLAGTGLQPASVPPFEANAAKNLRRGSPAPAGDSGMQMSNQYVRTPSVRYPSRLRVGKIHPIKVSLNGTGVPSLGFQSLGGTFEPPVVIQVTVPGAVVTPPHMIVPLAGGEANFYVQPLLAGRLVGAKVEFLSQGRRISEINLPMKANRGRLARWLAVFAIILPFLINYFPELTFVDRVKRNPARVKPESPKSSPPQKQLPALLPSDPATDFHAGALEVLISTLIHQPPEGEKSEKLSPDPKATEKSPKDAKPGPTKEDEPKEDQSGSELNPPREVTITYHGEDAIWGWVRSKLHQHGYSTRLLTVGHSDEEGIGPILNLVTVQRRYEITEDSPTEWNTGKVVANGFYYVEPVLRSLYRLFIVFPNPKNWPFGDLIYFLFFLSLAAMVWFLTNPNRRHIKGPVLNIHVGT